MGSDVFEALDFETCRFRPGLQAPPPVCLGAAWLGGSALYPTAELDEEFRKRLIAAAEGKLTIVGHNFAYDASCALAWIPDIAEPLFAAYERDAIVDTMLYERVAEIGKYTPRKDLGLANVAAAYGIEVEKEEVRTDYGRLYGAPLSEYSEAHVRYATNDPIATLKLFERQCARHGKHVNLKDVALLARKQFWLQLVRGWGLRTDPERLDVLRKECLEHVSALRALAQEAGLIRADGTRDMAAIRARVTEAYDGKPPMTEEPKRKPDAPPRKKPWKPNVRTDKVTLQESGDPVLENFAEYGEWSAVENKDIPMLLSGAEYPIHTRFGIADTTRSTSSAPNVQNFRRKAGIRECIVPRPGHCFVAVDHGGLELSTLAQVLIWTLGRRRMADKINNGVDLHCDTAQHFVGLPYEEVKRRYEANDEAIKTARNCAKVENFGKPGGMADATIIHYAKASYGLDFEQIAKQLGKASALALAIELGQHWAKANPDVVDYLSWIKRLPNEAGGKALTIPGTTIRRRGAPFCAAANSHFQGLGAVVEAYVGWQIAREMYLGVQPDGKRSVLRHARQVNFVHDEHILECPIGSQTEIGARLEVIMAEAPRRYMPDVAVRSEAVAMSRWSKKAKRLIDSSGNLLVWDEAA